MTSLSKAHPSLRQRISDELLPFVERPAQYIGGEVNQLVAPGDWERAEVRVAIGFPDAYTVGMSHLGCQILYWLCNHTPGVCAERTYAPWIDAEQIMRSRGIPLFTWDTRQAVRDADIFAISLQYELCFTTVLNMLDLAGIPLRHAERMSSKCGLRVPNHESDQGTRPPEFAFRPSQNEIPDWPLVLVGGPQADNPEPMAEFVDLVVFGDGEHSLAAILEACREYKRAGVPRRDMIERLARRFPWCYAPNLYDVTYRADGTIEKLAPKLPGLPTTFERCKTPDFDDAPFPRRPLVPWVEVVHDRIGIEIMRGCPQVCRFCHAGYTKRPLHYRTPDRILEIAEEAYWATGQHELGLLSLSTADYPRLHELAAKANARFAPRKVNLSFPSLRVDKMLQHIPAMANQVRKGSITLAVEAARDDMRHAIRKKVTDGNLLDGVREVYKAGWRKVKLYFMAGFPGERDEDIDGIWELANAVSEERRKLGLPPAQVTASIGWLVPKPFTPFQWAAQPRVEYFQRVRRRLLALSRPGRGRVAVEAGMGGYGSVAAMKWESNEGAVRASRPSQPVAAAVHRSQPGAAEPHRVGRASCPPSDGLQSPGAQQHALQAPATECATENADARIRAPNDVRHRSANTGGRWNGRKSLVKIQMHNPQRSILEGVFARGDRRLGAVIHEAWRRGARFDAWDETYDDAIWQAAFAATGVDAAWYAHRERRLDEHLPWDPIDLRIGRAFLEKGYRDVLTTLGAQRREESVASADPKPLALPVLTH